MVYNYKCHNCGSVFSINLSFSEFDKRKNEGQKCPKCNAKSSKRIILSAPAITFVGEDFYINANKEIK